MIFSWEIRLILAAIIVTITGAIGTYIHVTLKDKYLKQGYNQAIQEIALQNQQAVTLAESIRAKVTQCYGGGGQWDIETGTCVKSGS